MKTPPLNKNTLNVIAQVYYSYQQTVKLFILLLPFLCKEGFTSPCCTTVTVRPPLVSAKKLTPHWLTEIPNQTVNCVCSSCYLHTRVKIIAIAWSLRKKSYWNDLLIFLPSPHTDMCLLHSTSFMVECRLSSMDVSRFSSIFTLFSGSCFRFQMLCCSTESCVIWRPISDGLWMHTAAASVIET